nr:hypothetical protein [Mucilaginibacter sp. SP1R1]
MALNKNNKKWVLAIIGMAVLVFLVDYLMNYFRHR